MNTLLQFIVAIWIQWGHDDGERPGEASYIWLCIVFAAIANILCIVQFVSKNVDSAPPDVGQPVESELSRKLSERPEESVMILMLGLIDTEFLCFLTGDEQMHMRFRQMALVSQLIQGLPMTFLQMSIIYSKDWTAFLAMSFLITVFTLIVRRPSHIAHAPPTRHTPHATRHTPHASPTLLPRTTPVSISTTSVSISTRSVSIPTTSVGISTSN